MSSDIEEEKMGEERSTYGKKVNYTVVQGLRLCTGLTAYRGSRGIALLYRH
jgi:hypothetical protein